MNANKNLRLSKLNMKPKRLSRLLLVQLEFKLDNSLKKRIEDSLVIEARVRAYKSQIPQNKYEFGVQSVHSIFDLGNQAINWAVKKSGRAWKDTRRSFGLYW